MQYKLVRIGLHKKDSLNNSYSIVKRYNLLKENLYISQELSKTGSWTHNLISNEVYLSEEVYEILGRDNKGFDGNLENYYLCIYPDDLEKVKRATQGALSGNEYDIEYRITTADGTIKYVHEKTKALCDENGKPVKMVGIIQDITEHKILEKSLKALGNKIIQPIRATEVGLTKNKMLQLKLKNSYRIINQTQDLAHMGSWEMDLIKNRIFFSDEAYRIYGIIPEQYDGTYDGFLKKFILKM